MGKCYGFGVDEFDVLVLKMGDENSYIDYAVFILELLGIVDAAEIQKI